MLQIAELGYHGTLRENYEKGYSQGVYDKAKVDMTAHEGIHFAETKESALAWARLTAREVYGQRLDDKIIILWGMRIANSAMSVDLVFEPTFEESNLVFKNITETMLY